MITFQVKWWCLCSQEAWEEAESRLTVFSKNPFRSPCLFILSQESPSQERSRETRRNANRLSSFLQFPSVYLTIRVSVVLHELPANDAETLLVQKRYKRCSCSCTSSSSLKRHHERMPTCDQWFLVKTLCFSSRRFATEVLWGTRPVIKVSVPGQESLFQKSLSNANSSQSLLSLHYAWMR